MWSRVSLARVTAQSRGSHNQHIHSSPRCRTAIRHRTSDPAHSAASFEERHKIGPCLRPNWMEEIGGGLGVASYEHPWNTMSGDGGGGTLTGGGLSALPLPIGLRPRCRGVCPPTRGDHAAHG